MKYGIYDNNYVICHNNRMYHSYGREVPGPFVEATQAFAVQHTELQARFSVAVGDITRLALERGNIPLGGSEQERVLYTLDGNLSDAGGHDDYAQRLHVDLRPQASGCDTGISFRRFMPLRQLGAGATMFDSRNEAQVIHMLSKDEEIRYAVSPLSGALECIQRPSDIPSAAAAAYNQTVLRASELALSNDIVTSFEQAIQADIDNPAGITDNIRRFNEESRDLQNIGPRIRQLIAALEDSKDTPGAELAGQLMLPDIGRVASLAVIHSALYYEKERRHVSFDRRLQWVAGYAGIFSAAVKAFLEPLTGEFHDVLTAELDKAQQIVRTAERVAADTQPPHATFIDGSFWRISRVV